MSILDRFRRRPVEVHHRPEIRFIGEQDGPAERELKDALRTLFADTPSIERAYLVHVDYGNPDVYEVALCIQGPDDDEHLVRRISEAFAKLFGFEQHLDTLFLTPARQREIAQVAAPFYSGPGAGNS
jgi:hypothetical protein